MLQAIDVFLFQIERMLAMTEELKKFINACIKEYEYQIDGDSKNGNKQGKIIISICVQLKNENSLNELLSLLDHEHPQVRFRAAERTLLSFPDRAERVLEELSMLRGIEFGKIGFVSQITLQEWKKGNLKFPTNETLKRLENDN